jgi:hypothetical protein
MSCDREAKHLHRRNPSEKIIEKERQLVAEWRACQWRRRCPLASSSYLASLQSTDTRVPAILRASSPALLLKRLLRSALNLGHGLNRCTTGGFKNVPACPRAQINSRRSRAGPCAAGSRHSGKRAPSPRARQNQPQKNPPSPLLHPSEQPPSATPCPFLAPLPLYRSKKAPRRFPAAVWRGCRCRRRGYRRRTHRRRPTPPARCSSICLAGHYGQRRRARDGGDARG